MNPLWRPGETVVVRDVFGGRVRSAVAMLMVDDQPDQVILFQPRGAPFALPADRAGHLTKDPLSFDHMADIRWNAPEQILIARRDAEHAVMVRLGGSRKVIEWYVNLQAPFERTRLGFDTTDYVLDVVISADRCRWRWKDQEELDRLVAAGQFSADQAKGFYREGRRVADAARRGQPPFEDRWEGWLPDPSWRVEADLPEGWSSVDPVSLL